jgi:hypothetical protein
MPKVEKLTLADIQARCGQYRVALLSNEYHNSKEKLLFKCLDCSAERSISWSHLALGKSCKSCYHRTRLVPQEVVEASYKKEGYQVQSKYFGQYQKMQILCPKGHVFQGDYLHWKAGKRCPQCRIWKRSLIEIASALSAEQYQLVQTEYHHNKIPLKIVCPAGHATTIWWGNWLKGHRCQECFKTKLIALPEVLDDLQHRGFSMTEKSQLEYINAHTPVTLHCDKGHAFPTRYSYIRNGSGCTVCALSANSSKAERELLERLRDLNPTHKTLLKDEEGTFEVDIFFPEKRIAVEYCGLYWHSTLFIKDDWKHADSRENLYKINRTRHLRKAKRAEALGIQLLTVFEDEYHHRPDLVESIIRSKLGGFKQKLSARSCKVVYNDPRVKEFFDQNHLQRSTPHIFCAALEYEGQIVGALSLGKPARAHVTQGLEIKRLAFNQGTTVMGGTERLWLACLSQIPDNVTEIISFCDRRYSNGGVYARLGMTLRRETGATPHIVDKWKRLRYQTFAGKPQELSKYGLIYDCGHQRWEWHR